MMWRVRRMRAQLVGALIATGLSAGCTAGVYSAFIGSSVTDPGSRVIAGLVLSAALWWCAYILRERIVDTRDYELLRLTPLTLRRYVATNVVRVWPALFVTYVAFPIAGMFLLTELIRGGNSAASQFGLLAQVNFILTFFVMMLGPLSLTASWAQARLPWVFALRHVGARFPVTTFFVLVAGFILQLSTGWVELGLRLGAAQVLALGDPGFALVALVSPVSALLVQEVASPGATLVYALVAAVTLAVQLWPLSRIVSFSQGKWEHQEFTRQTANQAELMSSTEEWEDKQNTELDGWMIQRQTYARDCEGTTMPDAVAYDDTCAQETQVARYIAAAENNYDDFWGRSLAQVHRIWLWLLLTLVVGWLIARNFSPHAEWFGVAAMALQFGRHAFAGNPWADRIPRAFGLPLRLLRVIRATEAAHWFYNVATDACAAALFVLAWEQPIVSVIPCVVALQAMRYCSHVHYWLGLIAATGKKWPDTLWHVTAICLWGGSFIAVVLLRAEVTAAMEIQSAAWWWIAVVDAFAAFTGIGLLAWLHRKTDSSVPFLVTSLTGGHDYEDD